LADAVVARLEKEGVKVWRGIVPDTGEFASAVADMDMVFALGGDGTILHAGKLAASVHVPIVGVDFGRFGFLAELIPSEALAKLPLFINGQYWLEERQMLQAEIVRNDQKVGVYQALNDIVVGRDNLSGVIDVGLGINDEHVTTFIGDGLVVSTATGSTAYNLATGGPVVSPIMRAIVISAIAPHLTHLGHLIVSENDIVHLHVGTRKGASVTIDGQPDFSIQDQDMLTINNSPHVAYFARVQSKTYFYKTLANRLRRGG
jgi:NAD+ kinase